MKWTKKKVSDGALIAYFDGVQIIDSFKGNEIMFEKFYQNLKILININKKQIKMWYVDNKCISVAIFEIKKKEIAYF